MKNLPNISLVVIIIIYLALAVVFSQTLHFSRALDEGYHLELTTFLQKNGRLPVTYEERAQITKSDYPPLYQGLTALFSANVDLEAGPDFKYYWDSARYRAADMQTDNPGLLYTEDFERPYLGRLMIWQVGRWFSILLSVSTVVIVFFTLQEIPLGYKPWTSLFGAAWLAFLPRYLIVGSALNDDNLLGLLAALFFWMLIKAVKHPAKWWPFVAMGVLLGLAVTTKYSVVLVPLEVIIVLSVLAYQAKLGWLWWAQRLATVGGLAILCSSWWFGWNIWFFNTIAQDGWLVGLVRSLFIGGYDITLNRIGGILSGGAVGGADLPERVGEGTFAQWLTVTFLTFWSYSLNNSYPLFPVGHAFMLAILVGAGIGLWRLWRTESTTRVWLMVSGFHLLLFVILPIVRFISTRRIGETAQGRHILIPAATAVVALIVWGLNSLTPKQWRRPVFAIAVIANIIWTSVHLYQLSYKDGTLLPTRAVAQAAESLSQPVNARFGDNIELVSYDLNPKPGEGRLDLNLAWRSLAYANENYLLKVELIDSQRDIVSHWIGYNGQGRLPTLAWDPGDSVFDRLVLPLPNLPAGDYQLWVQMMNRAGPLPVNETEVSLMLTQFTLDAPSDLDFSHRISVGEPAGSDIRFALWNSDGAVASDTRPIYRYPTTISIIMPGSADQNLSIQLIDSEGQLWSPTQAQADIYNFVIGPRWQSGDYRLRLSSEKGDETIGEPLLTVENWWPRQFETPNIENPVTANFANQVYLLGYQLPQDQVEAGDSFPITLYWQAPPDSSPQANFIQFNQLLDQSGQSYGGYERRPLEYYSTLLWAPGEIVVDGYTVPVEPNAPPGDYYLNVGYYLIVGESGVNLPLVVDGAMTEVSSVSIGPIEVVGSQP